MISAQAATDMNQRAAKCRGCRRLFPARSLTRVQEKAYIKPEFYCFTCAPIREYAAPVLAYLRQSLLQRPDWEGRVCIMIFDVKVATILATLYDHPDLAGELLYQIQQRVLRQQNPYLVGSTILETISAALLAEKYKEATL